MGIDFLSGHGVSPSGVSLLQTNLHFPQYEANKLVPLQTTCQPTTGTGVPSPLIFLNKITLQSCSGLLMLRRIFMMMGSINSSGSSAAITVQIIMNQKGNYVFFPGDNESSHRRQPNAICYEKHYHTQL